MFTNNYIKFRRATFSGHTTFTYKGVDGAQKTGYLNKAYSYSTDLGASMYTGKDTAPTTGTLGSAKGGVFFGSGSTPATRDDYNLVAPIAANTLTVTSPAALQFLDDGKGKYSFVADFIVRNSSDAEVNVWEIGLFTPAAHSSSELFYLCLMERTVLAEPITIPAGESKLVTYALHFNQILSVD